MGKKSRRKAKLRAAGKLAPRAPVGRIHPTKPMVESKAAAPSLAAAAPSLGSAISPVQTSRYQYILPELRLIGIISGALFIILIILALVLS
ncbi:MAG: hypothetical protein JSV54_03365 [Chloroflexota bacterium]|nr:MAG: hypothetical protein JSV54_03365 [Chloroflexota bacterium]